ncbi:MAG TPA: SAM-dependent methyltransferase [Streptosporangiaceae bacterium]
MTDRLAEATDQGRASSGTGVSTVNGVRYPLYDDCRTHHPFVDASVPNVARIYDYLLGGKDNYSADREAAVELVRLIPDALRACHNNRQFLQRTVRFLTTDASVSQFIDIGTGLPTRGNVHEVAQSIKPDARVLYVDYDPVVISHAQALLAKTPLVVAINRDLREPRQIITHPALQALIDLDKPFAILLIAVLHFIPDEDDPHGIVDELKAAMPSGSYLVVSHVTADEIPAQVTTKVRELYDRTTAPATPRTRSDIERFFDGMEIIAPGLTDVTAWRTAINLPTEANRTLFYGGIGRKP